ncbi:MAG: nucleoside hydrolase [Clostridia bacterium]|nr:nucleoside hydrolase [Clostridia bacterium]
MFFDDLKAGREKPVPLIFGTDWWTDCDDVAALHILLKAHNSGLIDLKAIGVNSVMRHSAPSVKAVCEEQGLSQIPIGLDSKAKRRGAFCLYQKTLASYYKSGLTNESCPEAYKLYRKALAEADDKCVIVDVGFPQIVAELLRSEPDEISGLDGLRLTESKVREIVLMGGRWDKQEGREYNFFAYKLNREAAAYICETCPVPLTFLGYEVGKDIVTGGKDVPGLVGAAYEAHLSPRGRPSWDPMTALYALTGDAETAGYKKVYGQASVDPATGKNSFVPREGGPHAYLVKEKEDAFYKEQIDAILRMTEAKR